jgi:acyl carrier protein
MSSHGQVLGGSASGGFDTEAQIAAIWCEVLGVEHVSPEDNFVQLGGDSLGAVVCLQEIQERLGMRLSLADFLDPSMTLRVCAHSLSLKREDS